MDAKLIVKLVPEEIRSGYTFSRDGIVTSPGKFEGESIETLYYYDCFINGDGCIFEITTEEAEAFDIDSPYVYLGETGDGFAYLVECETLEEAEDLEADALNIDY